jgi:hypothetical protein
MAYHAGMRVLVVGGYGNFGARICRALSRHPAYQVLAAGRNPVAGARSAGFDSRIAGTRLDLTAPDFGAALRALSPSIVIHCAGPFQGQDYRVAEASIAAGAHYVDLADGRAFVAGFAGSLDRGAHAADVVAVSGASSVPALSSAVVDDLAGRFRELREIRIAIAPGQRAPRGIATLAGVFSYAGRPFQWLSDGKWTTTHGWQNLVRLRFIGLGTRWAAACEVPDLDLFPMRYPGVRTVEFRAALELGLQHLALWAAAGMRRAGLPLPLRRWAGSLNRLASLMDRFGSERGGMLVSVRGIRHDGAPGRVEWHLTADASHGPEIPCMAAVLVTHKIAAGGIAVRGAYPCMGFLSLSEFGPEFARWGMDSVIEQSWL